MEISEQALNEQERRGIERGGFRNTIESAEAKEDNEVHEHVYEQNEGNSGENLGSLKKDYLKTKSDYKKLLISYNELSMAFRAHISSNHSEYLTEIISDLKSEKEKLKGQNRFYLEQLHAVLVEMKRIQSNGEFSAESGMDFASIEELVFQNLYLKEIIKEEDNEKLGALEKKISQGEEIRNSQDKVIEGLKMEISTLQKYPQFELGALSRINKVDERLKVKEAMIEEILKENKLLKKDAGSFKSKEKKYSEEILRLREEIARANDLLNATRKYSDLLQRENAYLSDTNKELEKIGIGNVLRFSESKVIDEVKIIRNDNSQLQRKNFMLELEVKKLKQIISESEESFEIERNENSNKVLEMETKVVNICEKKDREINKLKEGTGEYMRRYEESERQSENLSKELTESLKNCKKMNDELESMKKVTGKRVSQLEAALVGKTQDLDRLASANDSIVLNKLVLLLQKSLSHNPTV